MKSAQQENSGSAKDTSESWLELVRRHVESLDFGVVQVVVHDSRVVQIERTEKVRFAKPGAASIEGR